MGGTSQIQRNPVATRILDLPTSRGEKYDLPDVIQVEADGPIRVIRLNRPEQLNATNHELHAGLAALFPQLDADAEARVAVITGNGRAFSAGGDFGYIDELVKDAEPRHQSLTHGRQIVTGMVACCAPVVAVVNGPAVGLGCSIVALSDIVYMAESAHLADPHVMVGLVAADGGPVTWPLLTSLQLAKEYALTGDKIPAQRAAQIGLVNHVCPDDEVLDQALACARRIAKLPQRAAEDTKRILNMHLERAVLATLDFALTAEDRSFTSPSCGPTSTGCCPARPETRGAPPRGLRTRRRAAGAAARRAGHRRRECPPALVRAVVDGGDDGEGLWKTFVELDWPSRRCPPTTAAWGWRRSSWSSRSRSSAAWPTRPRSWPRPASTCRWCGRAPTASGAPDCSAPCAPARPGGRLRRRRRAGPARRRRLGARRHGAPRRRRRPGRRGRGGRRHRRRRGRLRRPVGLGGVDPDAHVRRVVPPRRGACRRVGSPPTGPSPARASRTASSGPGRRRSPAWPP